MKAQDSYAHWIAEEADTSWMEWAACRGKWDLWFTATSTSSAQKLICSGCTVREECLAYALEMGETHWVWGGEAPDERRRHGPPMQTRYCAECHGYMRVQVTSNKRFCGSTCRNRAWMREDRAS